jgi:hypothetical protein
MISTTAIKRITTPAPTPAPTAPPPPEEEAAGPYIYHIIHDKILLELSMVHV